MKALFMFFILVQLSLPQQQLWYQRPNGNIGAAMSVSVHANGMIFASVYNKGIYRSIDTGKSWNQIAPFTEGVWSFAIRNHGEIIAGLWSKGLFRSENNGTTWSPVPTNLLYADVRAVSGDSEIIVEAEGRLLRSTNNGKEWKQSSIGAGAVVIIGDTIIAAKGTTVFRSTDQGKLWMPLANLNSPVYSLNAGADGNIAVGTFFDEGTKSPSFFIYDTTMKAWTGGGPPSTINALLRRKDGTLFAASHDSGFYSSVNNGITWKRSIAGLTTTKTYSLALLSDTVLVAGTLDGIFFTLGLSRVLSVDATEQTPAVLPDHFILRQNFPNPFNPSTTISYSIPASGLVSLRVYDLLGREVSRLVNTVQNVGDYSVTLDASSLSSGMYLYTLRSGNSTVTKRMMLVR